LLWHSGLLLQVAWGCGLWLKRGCWGCDAGTGAADHGGAQGRAREEHRRKSLADEGREEQDVKRWGDGWNGV
jgi:hypothetical protein